jgi:O-antigen/teichoic acid export membrane protein
MRSRAKAGGVMNLPAEARSFWKGVVPLLLALTISNGSNYIFHVVVSRLLGPAAYGGLAALLAVLLILSVPFGVIQTVVAKRVAIVRSDGRDGDIPALVSGTAMALLKVGVPIVVLLLALSPLLGDFLHISTGASSLLGPYAILAVLTAIPLGALQGRLQFGSLAWVSIFGVAVRLGIGISLVWLGWGIPGAVLGTVLAQAAQLVVGFGRLRLPSGWLRSARSDLAPLRGEFGAAMLQLGAFWLLAEVDVVLARHYLPAHTAGLYSAAGVLARALLFLPAAVSMVALPRFAETEGHGDAAGRWVRLSLGAVAGLMVLALPLMILLRDQVVTLAFGNAYRGADDLTPLVATAMALLAIANLLVYFHVAAGTRTYLITFGAVAGETVLIALFHGSWREIASILLGTSAAVAFLQYEAAAAVYRWRPPLSELFADDGGGQDGIWLAREPTLDLSVVLPCHNAGGGLRGVLSTLERELEGSGSYEIIVVSDGSTDATTTIAEEFPSDRVRVVARSRRRGKGAALRWGLAQARGRYIAFMDADGDIHPRTIRSFVVLMNLYEPDVVLGSKRHPMSEVKYPPLRRVMSWTYHKVTRLLFHVNVRDTQTGVKLLRRDVVEAVLPRMLEKRYAFDLELLVVARRLGYTRVFEAPIHLDYRFSSQVNVVATVRIVMDTLAIFYRRYVLGSYRREPGIETVTANKVGAREPAAVPARAETA